MSIASRIEAIEQHLTDDYSVLTLAGADLTNVDKNIVNLKPTWKERLLYFMNNGTQQVWNNWEKVEGTGETLTLNNTEEAPMSLVYKGNTYQNTTTGKNLLANSLARMKTNNTTGTWNNNAYTLNGIVFTPVYENDMLQYINVNGTATSQTDFIIGQTPLINGTTYTGTGCPSGGSTTTYRIFYTYIGADYGTGVMLTSTSTVSSLATVRVYSGATVNNLKFYPMVRLSNITDATYEPYTNGASPNPDYPQDIHVVSGDNSIEVGNNVFDISTITPNSFIDNNGNIYASSASNLSDYIEVKENNIILSYDYTSLVSTNTRAYCWFDSNKNFISGNLYSPVNKTNTFSVVSGAKYIRFTYDKNINNIKVSNQSASYPITLPEGMFLGWIPNTDYRDKIDKSSGKNLFNQSVSDTNCNIVNGMIVPNTTSTDFYIKGAPAYSEANKFLTLESGNYYIKTTNSNIRITMYGDNGNLDTVSNQPVTLSSTINFGGIRVRSLNSTSLQNIPFGIIISKTDSEYEPYGTGWYLRKAIGKVVLDGSENWVKHGSIASWFYYDGITNGYVLDNTQVLIKTNYYTPKAYQGVPNLVNGECSYGSSDGGITHRFVIKNTDYTQTQDFKTWLSTHNTMLYYVLSTPTYTLIEDSTLINQLETIKKSYEGQTNISQTNNDMPFIINATALKEMD